MLATAAPGGIFPFGSLQALLVSTAGVGSRAAIVVAVGTGALVGLADVGVNGATRVGVGPSGGVAVGVSVGIGAGVFEGVGGSGGGGVTNPLTVGRNSPVFPSL